MISIIAYENEVESLERERILDCLMNSLIFKIKASSSAKDNIPYFNRFINLRQRIYQHSEIQWDMDSISSDMNISPGYLYRLLRQVFLTTGTRDVINSRIAAAKRSLENTSLTIDQIAAATGYGNVEHFSR